MQGKELMTGFGRQDVPVFPFRDSWRRRLGTLESVDRVRLGRALGYGTRHAAKTVAAIAEAASAPERAATGTSAREGPGVQAPSPVTERPAASAAPRRGTPVTPRNLGHGVKHFKRSFWGPLATFSGALWLRVTGLFFGLIAFAMGGGAWRLRGGFLLRSQPAEAHRFWVFAAFTVLFGYFAVSSFVRATLRERCAATQSR